MMTNEEMEQILVNKGKGKPAFYNEEIDNTRLREKIKDLNEKIKEIQPLPVDNITESQELLFLEADSIAIIEYTIGKNDTNKDIRMGRVQEADYRYLVNTRNKNGFQNNKIMKFM